MLGVHHLVLELNHSKEKQILMIRTGLAIKATQNIMKSFTNRTDTTECSEITNCNFSSKLSLAKYFFTGKFLSCFDLAEKWAPEAIESARAELDKSNNLHNRCLSCASEVAIKMGASEEENSAVAGFAGGLGLSGGACGALAAVIWMKIVERCRNNDKTSYKDPKSEEILENFYKETNYEILCKNIAEKSFNSLDEHTEYIENGGCRNLINKLSQI